MIYISVAYIPGFSVIFMVAKSSQKPFGLLESKLKWLHYLVVY